MIQHNDKPQPNRNRRMVRIVTTVIVTLAIVAIAIGAFAPVRHATDSDTTNGKAAPTSVPSRTSSPAPSTTISMPQTASPSPTPKTDGTSDRAKRIVEAMSLDERAGQLVMAALQYGNDPATLQAMIQEQHVGNVILMGNWVSGVENVARATQALQRLNASTGLPGSFGTGIRCHAQRHGSGSDATRPAARSRAGLGPPPQTVRSRHESGSFGGHGDDRTCRQ